MADLVRIDRALRHGLEVQVQGRLAALPHDPLVSQEIAREIRALSQSWRNLKQVVLGGTENQIFELPNIYSKFRYTIMGGAKAASIAKINVETKVLKHFRWDCEEFGQDLRKHRSRRAVKLSYF